MKKILFVYHTSSIGGGSYCLLNILKSLNRDAYTPVVLLRNNGPLAQEIRALGIEVFYLSTLRTVPYNSSIISIFSIWSVFNILCSKNKYKNIVKHINPDILYINSMMLYPYLRFASRYNVKSIIHIREHWPEGEHPIQRKLALRGIVRHADSVIAINRYSASMLSPYNINVNIVYDWIDMSDRFESISLDDLFGEDVSNKKIYLYLGGMQKIKGAYEVINTFTHKIDDPNARLLALGINPRYKSSGIKRIIKSIMSCIGMKTYSQRVIDLILSDSRIRCMPGTYKLGELFKRSYCIMSFFTIPHANLALAESILCNAVNVAASNDEALEYSLEGELAVLYEPNNINSFEESLLSLNKVRNEKLALIEAKSHQVKEMFDPSRNIYILHSVLSDLING